MRIKPDEAFMDQFAQTKADDFLRRIKIGVNWGRKAPVLEHLSGPFYVAHKAGSSYLSGQTREYGRADHTLIDLRLDKDNRIGIRAFDAAHVNADYYKEGRFTKADRTKWLADIKDFMS